MIKPLALACVGLGCLAAGSASAATLSYTMTCSSAPSICDRIDNATMTFELPEFPTPSRHPANEFAIDNVDGFWNGSGTPTPVSVIFLSQNSGNTGGFSVQWGGNVIGGGGPQIYQGNGFSPQLVAGVFNFTGTTIVAEPRFASRMAWTVDVDLVPGAADPSPVPLPPGLALVAAAFGFGAVALRRPGRRRREA
jgi:hypothetical protein